DVPAEHREAGQVRGRRQPQYTEPAQRVIETLDPDVCK
ncbi:hypothetical protein LCGC14_2318560, partial [marine sediment metagenome]